MASRPAWISDRDACTEKLREFAAKGLPRIATRVACGLTNTQMGHACERAKIKFERDTRISYDAVRVVLAEAGFTDAIIDEALRAQSDLGRQNRTHVRSRPQTQEQRSAAHMTRASVKPAYANDPVARITSTEDEVTADWIKDVCAAADAIRD